jgi:hypothetical protein
MGLHLVAQLSSEYGWERRPGRKHVWARLPSGRPPLDARQERLPEPRAPQIWPD